MRRREFIAGTAAAAMWLPTARAQLPAMPTIGFLRSTPAGPFAHIVPAFRQGLKESGFFEGQNVTVEYRWVDNHLDRLPGLAADLARRQVAVIVGNLLGAEAARAATTTIPIVFVVGDDPVELGLVGSLSRPAGNVTGVTFFGGGQLGPQRLELLHDLVPKAAVIAVLTDPNFSGFELELPMIVAAGRTIRREIVVVKAASGHEFEPAFAGIVQAGAGALLVGGGPLLSSHRHEIVALAARHAIPAIYDLREYVVDGGLISYSASLTGAYRQAGIYTAKILKGAKPSELPVQQPTTFELVVNMKTAKALGIEISQSILFRADEVIE